MEPHPQVHKHKQKPRAILKVILHGAEQLPTKVIGAADVLCECRVDHHRAFSHVIKKSQSPYFSDEELILPIFSFDEAVHLKIIIWVFGKNKLKYLCEGSCLIDPSRFNSDDYRYKRLKLIRWGRRHKRPAGCVDVSLDIELAKKT